MKLTTETKKEIFKTYGGNEKNTGSTEAQVAMLTHRINHMTDHLKSAKKDHNTTRSLMKLVGQRKRFLNYLMRKDIENYRSLIQKLNIRK